ncbi:hypothetical protein [Paraburkholderia sp. BL6669N2]|uniref:hypothetical protein n=1 Tax=Paraburkholderia sp. BL6669N2 TaxID=1938807 RepID=UPI0011C04497|nr:hypothetical protein [Paraburkholderia sp. BL6669N2]
MQWFARVLEQPSAIWWTVQQRGLHASMLYAIRRRLTSLDPTSAQLNDETKRIWSLLYEALSPSGKGSDDSDWVNLHMRIHAEGWNNAVLRQLQDKGDCIDAGSIVRFTVDIHSRRGFDIAVPDNFVKPVVRIMRGLLERAITLLDDVQGSQKFHRAPAISPAGMSCVNGLNGTDTF